MTTGLTDHSTRSGKWMTFGTETRQHAGHVRERGWGPIELVVRRRLGGSGRSVGWGEGFGEPREEQIEASVEFGGAVVGGENRCQGT